MENGRIMLCKLMIREKLSKLQKSHKNLKFWNNLERIKQLQLCNYCEKKVAMEKRVCYNRKTGFYQTERSVHPE